MEKHFEILILGGGTAGLTVASQLAARIGGRHLAIVEPSATHYYQPLWTLVGGGIFPREDSAREEGDLIPDEVTWIRDAATSIDPETRRVATSDSRTLTYDFLVVAPGVVLQWTKIPGLAESVGKPRDRRREQLLIRDGGVDVGRDSVVPWRHGALHRASDAGEVRRRPAKNHVSGRGRRSG